MCFQLLIFQWQLPIGKENSKILQCNTLMLILGIFFHYMNKTLLFKANPKVSSRTGGLKFGLGLHLKLDFGYSYGRISACFKH